MTSTSRPFALAAALNLGFVALEVAASQWAHSAALLADAGHYLIDGLGLLAVGAAVWLGGSIAKDMVAVRVGPDLRKAVVGAPGYFAGSTQPATPYDLSRHHHCLNLRLATAGGIYAWEFERDGRDLRVRVDDPLTFNNARMIVDACLDGFGLFSMPEDIVGAYLADGALVRVLEDWRPPFSG